MNKKEKTGTNLPVQPHWSQKARNIAEVILQFTNVILTAPLKIPGQLLKGFRYLALIAGIVKTTTLQDEPPK